MTSFSLFWEKHYKDVGFCCIYYPLESNFMKDKNSAGDWIEQKLITYIDTGWMSDKKMKWIGYDRGGYLAWITPGGQLYNFDDLKRNEEGTRYEKEIGKLKINGDGNMPTDAGGDMDFYEWELMVLKKCGFCPGSGGSGKDKDEADQEEDAVTKNSATPNTYIPQWQGLAQGAAPDYAGIYGPGQSAVTDAGDVIYGAAVADAGYVTTARKYAGGIYGGGGAAGDDGTKIGDTIPKIPYSGLVALPVDLPPAPSPQPVQVPKLPNPVINIDDVIETVVPKPAIDKLKVKEPLAPKGEIRPIPGNKPKTLQQMIEESHRKPDAQPANKPTLNNNTNNADGKGQERADKAKEMVKNDKRIYGIGAGKIDCSGATKEISNAVGDGAFENIKYNAGFATSLAANQAKHLQDNEEFTTAIDDVKVGDYIFWTGKSAATIKNIDHTGIVTSIINGVITVASAEVANHTGTSFRETILTKTGAIWQKRNGTGGKKFVGAGRPKSKNK